MNKAKKVAAGIAAASVALAGAGVMAIFTDRAEGTATATAGTLDLELTQTWIADNDNYHLANKAAGQDDLIDPMLPGSVLNMEYTLENLGNKSMDVRETIVIHSADKAFAADPEFKLYKASDVTVDPATGAYIPKDNTVAVVAASELSADGKTITIKPATFTLNGTGANAEEEDGVNVTSVTPDYVILFNGNADNSWMGKKLTVDYLAEGKQHRNTGGKDAWDTMATSTLTLTSGYQAAAIADLENLSNN